MWIQTSFRIVVSSWITPRASMDTSKQNVTKYIWQVHHQRHPRVSPARHHGVRQEQRSTQPCGYEMQQMPSFLRVVLSFLCFDLCLLFGAPRLVIVGWYAVFAFSVWILALGAVWRDEREAVLFLWSRWERRLTWSSREFYTDLSQSHSVTSAPCEQLTGTPCYVEWLNMSEIKYVYRFRTTLSLLLHAKVTIYCSPSPWFIFFSPNEYDIAGWLLHSIGNRHHKLCYVVLGWPRHWTLHMRLGSLRILPPPKTLRVTHGFSYQVGLIQLSSRRWFFHC